MAGAERSNPGSELICRAPFVTMEFDPFGDVLACCANVLFPLGNVAHSTVDEIWHGPRASMLRTALRDGDLSLGCTICRHRLATGDPELPLEGYRFALPDGEPGWPTRLSFSLYNTCNLECVMCGPDRSSRIRSRRAHLAPLPRAYADTFFDEIQPYLDHCELADFVGGEPFLVKEHWRIWDSMIERGLHPRCGVTTNGTVWNERVEQVLSHFDTDIRISIDGLTPATFEAVRKGARHADVFANLERFRAYAAERGTDLVINWSFVRHSWFEFADMLLWAEDRQLPVNVLTVNEPEHGAQKLPTPQLEEVLAGLRRRDDEMAARLGLNLGIWQRQVAAIESELRSRRAGAPARPCMEPPSPTHAATVAASILTMAADPAFGRTGGNDLARRSRLRRLWRARRTTRRPPPQREAATTSLRRWEVGNHAVPTGGLQLGVVRADRAAGSLLSVDLGTSLPSPPPTGPEDVHGLVRWLTDSLGGHLWLIEEDRQPERIDHTLFFGAAARDKAGVVVRLCSYEADDGVEILLAPDYWFSSAASDEDDVRPVVVEPPRLVSRAPAPAGPPD